MPLGGMVKLAGEMQDERTNKPDEFFSQPWYRRNLIALAGPLMNYILAFALFALVAGVWGTMQPVRSACGRRSYSGVARGAGQAAGK